jgi:hypothetical protein
MKIYDTTQVRYAIVRTDRGDFKVCPNGTLLMWHEDIGDYHWFDPDKFNVGDLRLVIRHGLEAMAKQVL